MIISNAIVHKKRGECYEKTRLFLNVWFGFYSAPRSPPTSLVMNSSPKIPSKIPAHQFLRASSLWFDETGRPSASKHEVKKYTESQLRELITFIRKTVKTDPKGAEATITKHPARVRRREQAVMMKGENSAAAPLGPFFFPTGSARFYHKR